MGNKDTASLKTTLLRSILSSANINDDFIKELVKETIRTSIKSLGSSSAILWLFNGAMLTPVVLVDVHIDMNLSPGQDLVGISFQEDVSLSCDDTRSLSNSPFAAALAKQGIYSYAAVPLPIGNQIIGVYNVMDRHPREYNRRQLRNIEREAAYLSLYIRYIAFFPEFTPLRISRFPAPSMSNPRSLEESTPKGIHPDTLSTIYSCVAREQHAMTSYQVAKNTNISDVTVRKYLNYLTDLGVLSRRLEYGQVGRPYYLFALRKPETE